MTPESVARERRCIGPICSQPSSSWRYAAVRPGKPRNEDAPAPDGGACNEDGDQSPTAKPTSYDSIGGQSSATTAPVKLCPLVRLPMFEAGGLYRVASLEEAYEEDLWSPGSMAPFTYVELELLEPWFNVRAPRARTTCRPLDDKGAGQSQPHRRCRARTPR